MKAGKINFICRECGYESIKWLGKCPDCESWDSFDEFVIDNKPKATKKIGLNKAYFLLLL